MPRQCAICSKMKSRGNHRKLLRGHRNITGRRDFKPNLQPYTVDGERVLACTACIRTRTKKQRQAA